MKELVNYLLLGVASGSVYALLSLPLSLIWASTGVVDVAVGAYAVLAGLVAVEYGFPAGILVGVAVGMACAAVVGMLSFTVAARVKSDSTTLVLVGLVFLLMAGAVAQYVFGTDPYTFKGLRGAFRPFDLVVTKAMVTSVAVVIALVIALLVLLYRTRVGREMRAVASNTEGAALVGINVRVLQIGAFAIGGLLAAVAGMLLAANKGVTYESGLELTLAGFAAVILLGLGGPLRSVLGGLALGLLQAISVGYAPSSLSTMIPLFVIIVVLATGRSKVAEVAVRP